MATTNSARTPLRDGGLDLSVIVPVHNAESTLRPCLESIFANRGVNHEVIVVDDASDDASVRIAAGFPCRLILLASNIMAANCRNLGAQHARSNLLVFFDSDQVMKPDTLARFAEALRSHREVDAVVASFEADTPVPGFFAKFKNFRHHWVHQQARLEGVTLASGFTAIRRDVFLEHGGFEPAYKPSCIEDVALGHKLHRHGHRIQFRREIQVTHLKSYTMGSLLKSDLLDRAIPWTELALRSGMWRNDLNTSTSNTVSVALAGLLPVLLLLEASEGAAASLIAFGGIVIANLNLLVPMGRRYGVGFATLAGLFLPVMYFTHGLGLVLGIATHLLGVSVTQARQPTPQPKYEVLDNRSQAAST
jgi:GT2 family glycosyltransferase